MAKKTTKKFLNPMQIATLKDKGYKVKSNCFRIIVHEDEFKYDVWEQICEIAGVDPTSTEKLTLLSIGFIAE
jgi:hypothetical protein